ncbi:MAG: prolipoprotein diacylglyceryl transferase family protein [Gemmatimonadota bacterium]|nr:prolipoprotein diacylglyceryl transferase family protein [Gemmatimonadota bacterium]
MIPYLEQPSWRLGPVTVHAFGVIVAVAVLTGLVLGGRRFRQLGLDARVGDGLAGYVVVCGFLAAHLFSVLFYFPHEVVENPLVLLKVWEDISSFGGILGGIGGAWLYFRIKAPSIDRALRWVYVDVVAYVFPVSLAIGRIACSVAHDHPGTLTTLPLAVSLESGAARAYIDGVYRAAGRFAELPPTAVLARLGFHDLGWYEFVYLSLLVMPVTLALGRKSRTPGAFFMSFIALYMPVRFTLDSLRVSDVRYAGLTPAQWVALLLLAALPVLWIGRRRMTVAGTPLSRYEPFPPRLTGWNRDIGPTGRAPESAFNRFRSRGSQRARSEGDGLK